MAEPDSRSFGELQKSAAWEWSEVRGEFVPSHPSIVPVTKDFSASTNNLVYQPTSGKAVRIMWLCAQSVAANEENVVEATFRYGPDTSNLTDIYKFELVGSQPFPHRAVIDLPVNNRLYAHLSAARRVLINVDLREYAP